VSQEEIVVLSSSIKAVDVTAAVCAVWIPRVTLRVMISAVIFHGM